MRIAISRKVVDDNLERILVGKADCNCSWVDCSSVDNSVDYSVDNWLSNPVYRFPDFGLMNRKLIENLFAVTELLCGIEPQSDCYRNRLLSVAIRIVFAD